MRAGAGVTVLYLGVSCRLLCSRTVARNTCWDARSDFWGRSRFSCCVYRASCETVLAAYFVPKTRHAAVTWSHVPYLYTQQATFWYFGCYETDGHQGIGVPHGQRRVIDLGFWLSIMPRTRIPQPFSFSL
jgi:hypothetical protein